MNEIKAGLPAESEEIRTPFANTLLGLADTKRILGIRYSDWLLGAPSIEGGIATSSMAQDEWGHARLLYAALKDLGHDPVALEHERPAERYGSWDALDGELTDWAHLIAVVVVVDGALSAALESVMEGRYGPLEGRIGKMLGEEEFHAALGEAWFRRLAATEGEGRERLRSGVEEVLPSSVLCMAPGDDAHDALSDRGLLLPASSLRARLEDRIGPLLQLVDVPFPGDVRPDADWDPVRRRGPGHPSEEAVERARGDRNRALFVE